MTEKSPEIIIGIDPGYGRCGFGVIKENAFREYDALIYGVFTTQKDQQHAKRLSEIARDFRSIVSRYKPTLLVIEELFFSKSTTTALKVAEVRGVIMMLADELGLSVVEVKPNEVKITITGYGKADKKQVEAMVKTIFKLKEIPKPDDAADALAIAWTGAMKWRLLN